MSKDENHEEAVLGSWNPMRDDYNNSDLNKYLSGPGAGLLDNSKSDERESEKKPNLPYLVIKNTPKEFNNLTIRSILKDVSINRIYYHNRSAKYFVYLNSIADMEECIRKLEKISYEFTVEVGNARRNVDSHPIANVNNNDLPGDQLASSVNMEARTIMMSNTNRKHPQFGCKRLVNKSLYDCELSLITCHDPKGRYLNTKDEHELERCKVFHVENLPFDSESEYEYRAGRTILKFITGKKANISKKSEELKTIEEHKQIQESFKLKQCCACGEYCSTFCPQCSSRFCDASCQKNMYDKHIITCERKIELHYEPPHKTEILNKFNESHMPVSGSLVHMTAFEQSNVVYVRSMKNIDNQKYFDILKEIKFRSADAKKLEQTPQCGELVLLKLDYEYLRAMVLNADQTNAIKLVCVDYGNIDVQPLDKLYTICTQLSTLPSYVVPVELKDVPNCFMTLQYRKFLYYYLTTHTLKIIYRIHHFNIAKGMYSVELFDNVLHRSLNKCIKSMITPVEPALDDEVFFVKNLENLPLITDKDIELVVMDNSLIEYGFISATTINYAIEIEKFQKDVHAYGKATKPTSYAPQVDELCIAKYEIDDKWCRGHCLELVGDGHPTIMFIDYGNVCAVSIDNIRRYPAAFMYPIFTNGVDIMGLPTEWNDELIEKYQNMFPIGSTIKYDVAYNKDTDIYSINLN